MRRAHSTRNYQSTTTRGRLGSPMLRNDNMCHCTVCYVLTAGSYHSKGLCSLAFIEEGQSSISSPPTVHWRTILMAYSLYPKIKNRSCLALKKRGARSLGMFFALLFVAKIVKLLRLPPTPLLASCTPVGLHELLRTIPKTTHSRIPSRGAQLSRGRELAGNFTRAYGKVPPCEPCITKIFAATELYPGQTVRATAAHCELLAGLRSNLHLLWLWHHRWCNPWRLTGLLLPDTKYRQTHTHPHPCRPYNSHPTCPIRCSR